MKLNLILGFLLASHLPHKNKGNPPARVIMAMMIVLKWFNSQA
jgi:hypothetical protein